MALTTNSRVLFNSPLYIIDVFLEVIRERFKSGPGGIPNQVPGWQWTADNKETQIFIETGFHEYTEVMNPRPAVFVHRLQSVPTEAVIGNFAHREIPTGLHAFYTQETSTFQIDCQSKSPAECAIIADIIQKHILAARDLIRETFKLRKITNPMLGGTRPLERDTTLYNTSVTFAAEADILWATYDVGPTLRRLRVTLKDKGAINIIDNTTTVITPPAFGSFDDLTKK